MPDPLNSKLLELLRQALDLAAEALFFCDASSDDQVILHELRDDGVVFQPPLSSKVITETAMLLRAVTASPLSSDDSIAVRTDRLFTCLIERLEMDKRIAFLHQKPWLVLEALAPYVHLNQLGYRHRLAESLLQHACESGVLWRAEQAPAQKLELQWLYWLQTGTIHPDTHVTLASSCLARGLPVAGVATDDVYAFTHCILFLSDLGHKNWLPIPRETSEIVSEAEALLITSMDYDNFDLTAELLWTWPILGLSIDVASGFFLSVLCDVQGGTGFLPGPHFCEEHLGKVSEGLQRRYVVATSYHSTLAMGILAALLSRQQDHPRHQDHIIHDPRHDESMAIGALTQSETSCTSGASPLHALIPALSRPPVWESYWGADHASAYTPLLVKVALRRAVEQGDLQSVRECMRVILSEELDECPLSSEALAWMQRLVLIGREGLGTKTPEAESLLT